MGYTKDLWTKPARDENGKVVRDKDGKVVREPNARWGKGKRWQANWQDPDGGTPSQTFVNKTQANEYWRAMETDRARGDYVDPKAGREKFGEIAQRWLRSHDADPVSIATYKRVYRLHIEPELGSRTVKGVKHSRVLEVLAKSSPGNRQTVRLILYGVFELAKKDGSIRENPAAGIRVPTPVQRRVSVWSDDEVAKLIAKHPEYLKVAPVLMGGCGLRKSEMFALSPDDLERGDDPVVHVRRQIKKVDNTWVFAPPKRGKERDVPLNGWVSAYIDACPVKPITVTLPWEKPGGKPQTHRLLASKDGRHLHPTTYDRIWLPTLYAAGLTGEPTKDKRGRLQYQRSLETGTHALRHYYASMLLADGASIREVAEYLGHSDPGFTLRVYGHMVPDSHERARKAVDARWLRPRAV